MCTAKQPDPIPAPAPAPDFQDDFASLAQDVERDRQKSIFAGLASTIRGSASGVLTKSSTTAGKR